MKFFDKNIPLEMKDRKQWVAYFKKAEPGSSHVGKVMVSPIFLNGSGAVARNEIELVRFCEFFKSLPRFFEKVSRIVCV